MVSLILFYFVIDDLQIWPLHRSIVVPKYYTKGLLVEFWSGKTKIEIQLYFLLQRLFCSNFASKTAKCRICYKTSAKCYNICCTKSITANDAFCGFCFKIVSKQMPAQGDGNGFPFLFPNFKTQPNEL